MYLMKSGACTSECRDAECRRWVYVCRYVCLQLCVCAHALALIPSPSRLSPSLLLCLSFLCARVLSPPPPPPPPLSLALLLSCSLSWSISPDCCASNVQSVRLCVERENCLRTRSLMHEIVGVKIDFPVHFHRVYILLYTFSAHSPIEYARGKCRKIVE